MQLLSKNWYRAKRRLASQSAARIDAAARRRRGAGTPCEHAWSLVRVEDTWSGPLRVSCCSRCPAVLQEWPVASLSEVTDPDGSAD